MVLKGFKKINGVKMKIIFFLLISFTIAAQQQFDAKIDSAFANAKKGVQWSFSHIPDSKKTLNHDLIVGDKLVSSTKLYKEYTGVKVVSEGYFESISVSITVYKSYSNLVSEGYIRKADLEFIKR